MLLKPELFSGSWWGWLAKRPKSRSSQGLSWWVWPKDLHLEHFPRCCCCCCWTGGPCFENHCSKAKKPAQEQDRHFRSRFFYLGATTWSRSFTSLKLKYTACNKGAISRALSETGLLKHQLASILKMGVQISWMKRWSDCLLLSALLVHFCMHMASSSARGMNYVDVSARCSTFLLGTQLYSKLLKGLGLPNVQFTMTALGHIIFSSVFCGQTDRDGWTWCVANKSQ